LVSGPSVTEQQTFWLGRKKKNCPTSCSSGGLFPNKNKNKHSLAIPERASQKNNTQPFQFPPGRYDKDFALTVLRMHKKKKKIVIDRGYATTSVPSLVKVQHHYYLSTNVVIDT